MLGNRDHRQMAKVVHAIDTYFQEKKSMGFVTNISPVVCLVGMGIINMEDSEYYNEVSVLKRYYSDILCPELARIYCQYRASPCIEYRRTTLGLRADAWAIKILTLCPTVLHRVTWTEAHVAHLTEFLRTEYQVWWVPPLE